MTIPPATPSPAQSNAVPPSSTDRVEQMVLLLQQNQALLQRLVQLKEREHRIARYRFIWALVHSLLPFILAIGFSYYLYTVTTDQINGLKTFIQSFIPSTDSLKNIKLF